MSSKQTQPAWARSLGKKLTPGIGSSVSRQVSVLRLGVHALAKLKGRSQLGRVHALVLPEQPFDAQLLAASPLYRKSREIYVKEGGVFRAALVSSPRTLSSPILLEQIIEYSPIEREFVWAATDAKQIRNPGHLLGLRTFASSLFHEQSHRILWRILPRPPRSADGLRRYLNFVESLVITLDMALGDELGPGLASVFYLSGVTYDPGTDISRLRLSPRDYRNYLQAALHATYLCLEMYDPKRIPGAISALYPQLGDLAKRAALRSCNLDRGFITRTNPIWQKQHRVAVAKTLSKLPGAPLDLAKDPMDNRLQYLMGEQWLERFGL